ncbi:MAG: hypothetical protein KF732_08020 [Flavobacteriales bacterium]|nr:hypothetical protein [Flavobacteriales bacterium]
MKTTIIKTQSDLPISELLNRLYQVTAEEFETAKKSCAIQYYGCIEDKAFDIRNVKYSPYSTGPSIQGEIEEIAGGKTMLNINIDIDEHNSYTNTILTLTILVIGVLATLFSLSSEVDKITMLSIFGVMMIFALLYVIMIKLILKSTRKSELRKFLEITKSKLI